MLEFTPLLSQRHLTTLVSTIAPATQDYFILSQHQPPSSNSGQVMRPKPGTNEPPLVIVKQEGMKVKDIKAILKDSTYNGFPGMLHCLIS